MTRTLVPLFGMACIDEAMPPGTDIQCISALADSPALARAFALAPELTVTNDLGNTPNPPDNDYSVNNAPKFSM